MNKIEKEELEKITSQQVKMTTILNEIGFLETKKHQMLHDVSGLNDIINEYKKELQEKYGEVNINLEDGTYSSIEKEESVEH